MAWAVVSSYSGASKTTIIDGGVSKDVYVFASTAGGSITFTAPGDVEFLGAAGGGSGAIHLFAYGLGGAGSGGVRKFVAGEAGNTEAGPAVVAATTYAIAPGAGGAARLDTETSSNVAQGNPGTATTFLGLTCNPGAGGRQGSAVASGSFGSGQGGVTGNGTGSPGTAGQGYAGGDYLHSETFRQGAAGGSASQKGLNSTTSLALGSFTPGLASAITGTSLEYGRGGPGSSYSSNVDPSLLDGRDGFGDGAGGQPNANSGTHKRSGKGGSGVVILRVPTPEANTPPAVDADAAGQIALSGSSTSQSTVTGQSSGSIDWTGLSQAQTLIQGQSVGVLDLTGEGFGSTSTGGMATGSLDLTGNALANIVATATAASSLDLSGSSEGTSEVVASSTGQVGLGGAAEACVTTTAGVTGTLDLTGQSAVQVLALGSAAGSVGFSGESISTVTVIGAASGVLEFSGDGILFAGMLKRRAARITDKALAGHLQNSPRKGTVRQQ